MKPVAPTMIQAYDLLMKQLGGSKLLPNPNPCGLDRQCKNPKCRAIRKDK